MFLLLYLKTTLAPLGLCLLLNPFPLERQTKDLPCGSLVQETEIFSFWLSSEQTSPGVSCFSALPWLGSTAASQLWAPTANSQYLHCLSSDSLGWNWPLDTSAQAYSPQRSGLRRLHSQALSVGLWNGDWLQWGRCFWCWQRFPSRSPDSVEQQQCLRVTFSHASLERWGNAAWELSFLQQHLLVSAKNQSNCSIICFPFKAFILFPFKALSNIWKTLNFTWNIVITASKLFKCISPV